MQTADTQEAIKEFQGDYRWLSNFQYCEVVYKGVKYTTTENAYQAQKYDSEEWREFCQEEKPSTVKRVANLLRENPFAFDDSIMLELAQNWHKDKLTVMQELQELKYAKPQFRNKLIATKELQIEEGNYWYDDFWGVCLKTGKGQNHLGKIIMSIRERLQKESPYRLPEKINLADYEKPLLSDQRDFIIQFREFMQSDTKFFLLDGEAGTGKTFVTQAIIGELVHGLENSKKENYMKIYSTGMTNNAVEVSQDSSTFESSRLKYETLHQFLELKSVTDKKTGNLIYVHPSEHPSWQGKYRHKYEEVTLVKIDEISMLKSKEYDYLINLSVKYPNLKFLFTGDSGQLDPVDSNKLMDIISPVFVPEVQQADNIQVATLKKVVRQGETNPMLTLARQVRVKENEAGNEMAFEGIKSRQSNFTKLNDINVGYAFLPSKLHTTHHQNGSITINSIGDKAYEYLSTLFQSGQDTVVLAYRNKMVKAYNQLIREILYGKGICKLVVGERLKVDGYCGRYEESVSYEEATPENPAELSGLHAKSFANNQAKVLITELQEAETWLSIQGVPIKFKYYDVKAELGSKKTKITFRVVHEESERFYSAKLKELRKVALQKQTEEDWQAYNQLYHSFDKLSYAYAMTTHRSQGGTFDRVVIDLSDFEIMSSSRYVNMSTKSYQKLLYTALTRARHSTVFFT